jgi:hypothetical protein
MIFVCFPFYLFPNAAQPGFWNAGGTGTFSLLYPEDSLHYKNIQMIKELVSIQLYKGYAVVKGEYWMFNTTSDTVKIKVGYPINSNFSRTNFPDRYLIDIRFDSLYGLRAFRNDERVNFLRETVKNPNAHWENDNWYVWNNIFTPFDTTLITVYFIVNTNNTIIREGYNKDTNNGFIYLLETGATWKQPIVKGEIRIKLMDGVTIDDIKGVSPGSILKINIEAGILLTQFRNLSPTPENNIIITYTEKMDDFSFREVLNKENKLYNEIDNFSSLVIDESKLTNAQFGSPFMVHSSNWVFSILMFLLFTGGPILLITAIVVIAALIALIIIKRKKD